MTKEEIDQMVLNDELKVVDLLVIPEVNEEEDRLDCTTIEFNEGSPPNVSER